MCSAVNYPITVNFRNLPKNSCLLKGKSNSLMNCLVIEDIFIYNEGFFTFSVASKERVPNIEYSGSASSVYVPLPSSQPVIIWILTK